MLIESIVDGIARGSPDEIAITDYRGAQLGATAVLSPITIRRAIDIASEAGRTALQALAVAELVEIYHRASELFAGELEIGGETMSLDAYAQLVCRATGLPLTNALAAAHGIASAFRRDEVERLLKLWSADGTLAAYDTNVVTRGDVTFGWVPRGRCCAVVLPQNHPAVARRASLFPAAKMPVVLRASNREPFTAQRITWALLRAGLPPSAIHFVMTEQRVVNDLLGHADLGILYGSESAVAGYHNNRRIKTYGPGRSKVVVTRAATLEDAVETIYVSLTDSAGRGCINASSIVVEEGAIDPGAAVAAKLSELEPMDPLDPRAVIGAVEHAPAERLAHAVRSRMSGVRDLVTRWAEPLVEADGAWFLVPQLYRMPSTKEPFGDEYPFVFGTIASVPASELVAAASRSLSVSVIGATEQLAKALLREPTIGKVYRNAPTHAIDAAQPHDGLPSDLLYTAKAWR